MKTVEIKLYEFKELDLLKQQEVLQKYCDVNVWDEWWDCTFDELKTLGIKVTGMDLYRKEIGIENIVSYEEIAYNICHEFNGNSIYERAIQFSIDFEALNRKYDVDNNGFTFNEKNQDNYQDEYDGLSFEFKVDLCSEILDWLNNEYDYLTSDEAIISTIEANEWMFTENGVRYDY